MNAREGALARILESTRSELERRRAKVPLATLQGLAGEREPGGGGRFRDALARPGIGVIAEFKRRSPSAGGLRERADVRELVEAYERGGASALSVLTEGPHFDGSLEDLRAARAASALPILRKDFIVDPYQLYEARLAGADAVLLIVAALDQTELLMLHGLAGELGLDVLVEVHDSSELHLALDLEGAALGINNRDLRDFSVDIGRTAELMREVPPGAAVVSESGIAEAGQLTELARRGVDAVLVGELLMRARDPALAVMDLLGGAAEERAGESRELPADF